MLWETALKTKCSVCGAEPGKPCKVMDVDGEVVSSSKSFHGHRYKKSLKEKRRKKNNEQGK